MVNRTMIRRNPRLCPYCGSSVTRVIDADPDGEWLTLECGNCGYIYEADE